jgi:outer membrane protein OmpA-like peptidoglycan-associated protein
VAEPDTQAIVEALKPAVTRRTRNLLVRPAAPAPEGSASAAQSAATVATPEAAEPPSVSAGTPASAAAAEPRIDLAIRFDFNSARLRPESATLLASLASALVSPDLNGSRFLIEGHTDAQGTAAYNQRLSQLRAVEVQRFLVTHGVANNRLSSAGRGASDPANSAEPLAAENRRVRVVKVE